MAWTSNSTMLDNVAPIRDAPLHHAVPPFPFNAALFPPKGAPEPTDEEVVKAAEDAAAAHPHEVQVAEDTLVSIAKNPYMNESSRVRASQIILERHDAKVLIAQLRAEIEALKATKREEFENA